MLSSCLIETFPDTPSNAAIQFATGIQARDTDAAGTLLCKAATSASIAFDNPASFGRFAEFYERLQGRSVSGGGREYSTAEEVDLEVDKAWKELELSTEDLTETWRLHMVREDGKWKACDAELRP